MTNKDAIGFSVLVISAMSFFGGVIGYGYGSYGNSHGHGWGYGNGTCSPHRRRRAK